MGYEWIRTIKAGDAVIVISRGIRRIKTVDRITPTGQIVVEGSRYDKYGSQIGGDRFSSLSIQEATEEKMREIRQAEFVMKLVNKFDKAVADKTLTYERAYEINKILNGEADA